MSDTKSDTKSETPMLDALLESNLGIEPLTRYSRVIAFASDKERALTLALSQLAEARKGWQPIETAPKGGKWVLVYWPFVCEVAFAAYESRGCWHGAPTGDTWSYSAPTHWMPLPAPHARHSPRCATETAS